MNFWSYIDANPWWTFFYIWSIGLLVYSCVYEIARRRKT